MTEHITVSREQLRQIEESLDSRCGTNSAERTEILPKLRAALEQPAVEPVKWEWRWFDANPNTVTFGQWSEWKQVEPRNALCTVEDSLNEFRAYIANGQKYELRPLYTAPQLQQPVAKVIWPSAAGLPSIEWLVDTSSVSAGMALYAAPQAQQPDASCKFPLCQTEQYQQMLAKQVARDLFGDEKPQLLTDDEIVDHYCAIADGKEWAIGGLSDAVPFARAIEQAVLKKNGVVK